MLDLFSMDVLGTMRNAHQDILPARIPIANAHTDTHKQSDSGINMPETV